MRPAKNPVHQYKIAWLLSIVILLNSCAKNIDSIDSADTTISNNAILIPGKPPKPDNTILKKIGETSLNTPRESFACAAAGNKVAFAGGMTKVGLSEYSHSTVEMFDAVTLQRTTKYLSQARWRLAGAGAGNKMVFAGGINTVNHVRTVSKVVDIYNVETNTWSTAQLSEARHGLVAVALGTKIYFAGGITSNNSYSATVDIYDVNTNTWTTSSMVARVTIAGAGAGNKIAFAGEPLGGINNSVDIFDITANTWLITALSQVRNNVTAVGLGNQIFFVNGITPEGMPTSITDIYNTDSGTWSTAQFGLRPYAMGAGAIGTKIVFAGGRTPPATYASRIDIHDVETGSWANLYLSEPQSGPKVVCAAGRMFIGGGFRDNIQFTKLEVFALARVPL